MTAFSKINIFIRSINIQNKFSAQQWKCDIVTLEVKKMSREKKTEKDLLEWMNSKISEYNEDGDLKDCRKIKGVLRIVDDKLGPDECNWCLNYLPHDFPKIIYKDAQRLFNLKQL